MFFAHVCAQVNYTTLLKLFWDSHDEIYSYFKTWPTPAYRSRIFYTSHADYDQAVTSRAALQARTPNQTITTTIEAAQGTRFWPAEDFHQNYDKLIYHKQC